MNNEIKEKLIFIENKIYPKDSLLFKKWISLKDYITNLQQENEDNLKCIKSLKEQLESVINENQRLLKQWFEDNDKTVKLVSEKECYKSNYNDYKSRCEKAIEYIEEMLYPIGTCVNGSDLPYDSIESLLNILQNGSDSQ